MTRPTPLSELNRQASRQRKYHPVRPYRWWEYKPMQAEAPEVFYPLVDEDERRAASELLRIRGKRFWPNLGVGILVVFGFRATRAGRAPGGGGLHNLRHRASGPARGSPGR